MDSKGDKIDDSGSSRTATATHEDSSKTTDDAPIPQQKEQEQEQEQKQKKLREIALAAEEGHDADIPSNIGYVLDEEGERKRRQSISERRQHSLARIASHASRTSRASNHHGTDTGIEDVDLEKNGRMNNADEDEDETTEDEANVVFWDGPDDPDNPYNWPRWKKVVNVSLVSALTFITPLASSIFAPGVPQLMREFHSDSPELAAFVVSVYVLGFAFGPLLIAPLSEIYGRTIVYHVCNVGFVAFVIGCAKAPTLNSLIAFRFLSGLFGSCPLTNGGGTIADTIAQEKRGMAMASFSIGPLMGPIIGPVVGGFLAHAKGWRWVFWLIVIVSGTLSVVFFIFVRETYAPVLLQQKVKRLRKETGNELLRSKLDVGLSPRDYFARSIVRPMKMLFLSPITAIFALYMAVVYAYLYLMFTTITTLFEQTYNFSTDTVGLVFIGLGVGSLVGMLFFSLTSDRYIKKKAAESGSEMKPEYRLKYIPIGAILLPIGFFIYGWTAEYHKHWMAPISGMVVIGFANLVIFMGVQLYLVDAFAIYAASALAANTVIRSVAAAVLPLAALKMYAKLGLGWGNSLLGFIALAMVPLPFYILKYGEFLRKKYTLKL